MRRQRMNIRKMLNINILETTSVLQNKCFPLSLRDIIAHVRICFFIIHWEEGGLVFDLLLPMLVF
jgi:hypothetical protein